MQVAFFTVLFPNNVKYFEELLLSLSTQDSKQINLVICLDSLPNFTFPPKFDKYFNYSFFHSNGTISEVREIAFKKLLTYAFDFYIFIDSDDLVESNRLKIDSTLFKHDDELAIIAHDVLRFNENETPIWSKMGEWHNRVVDWKQVQIEDIQQCNFVGLGNISVRAKVLEELVKFQNIKALDWAIAYQWIFKKNKTIFTSQTRVGYRQHTSNLIGLSKITRERLLKIIESRIEFYKFVVEIDQSLIQNLEKETNIYIQIQKSTFNLTDALNKISTVNKNFFWWEEPTIL